MSVQGASIKEEGAGCRLIVVHATSAAPWQQLRDACEHALIQGFTFAAILHGAEALADERVLVEEDRQRAMRYRRPGDRHNFVLGRTIVHHLVRPRDASVPYAFALGAHGKPFLPGAPAFNLSHSDRWMACAVSHGEPIGIDVETFARLNDYRDLLGTVTHPAERHYIEQAPPQERLMLFKRCWVRKEAILKACGRGLGGGLQDIDVQLDQREPALHLPMPLRLVDLPLGGEHAVASLAHAPTARGVVVMIVDIPGHEHS